jgi:hypothetical protein
VKCEGNARSAKHEAGSSSCEETLFLFEAMSCLEDPFLPEYGAAKLRDSVPPRRDAELASRFCEAKIPQKSKIHELNKIVKRE